MRTNCTQPSRVNPNALAEADERDRERAASHIRGPLHGIPIALKDNVSHDDMPYHRRRSRLRWTLAAV